MVGKDVQITDPSGHTFGAYLAMPAQTPAPGVVVLQEIFGVNVFIRGIADQLARDGYIAIAPQLYWRQQADVQLDPDKDADMAKAMTLLKGLNEKQAMEDGESALRYLRSLKQFSGKAAAMGYCLGGKLAYLMAGHSEIDAAVAYYGTGIHMALEAAATLRAPVMLHIAGDDFLCDPSAQQAIIQRLEELKGTLPSETAVHIYKGAGHGFVREGKKTFMREAATIADSRTLEFYRRYLQPES